MADIIDISPTTSNTSLGSSDFRTTGRMISIAASDDGKVVIAGSLSSNVWISHDGGDNWDQIAWPQPPEGQFGVPAAMGGFCVPAVAVSPETGRWLVERDLRIATDLTGNGAADITGFGATGVWTAIGNGDGTFQPARVVLADFGFETGGWRVDRHPRLLADLTGNGSADIVGFGTDGVWTALGNGDGTFQPPRFVLADFGFEAGGWRVEKHPRFLVDLDGIGGADIVGFGDDGVWIALGNGDGTFQPPRFVLADFGFEAGGWRVDKHPRMLADLSGTGRMDIVGFGTDGVWTALGNGDGTFQPPQFVLADLGFEAGGWRVEKHPRVLAPLTDTGRADIVGFGDAGVWTALSNGDGTFQPPHFVLADFGVEAGGWRVDKHPRVVADLTGSGRADIVGFGDAGVYVALSNGDGTFKPPRFVLADFGFEGGGWRVEKHPRLLADLTGTGRMGIIGFGDAGVYVALGNADAAFEAPARFVLANFGYQLTLLAIMRNDREFQDSGIWRSSDGGRNWSRVHTFPLVNGGPPAAGQLVWAPGTGHLVFAAGSSALAISRDGGATFQNVMPLGGGGFQMVNHVAVAATPPASLNPPAAYAVLGTGAGTTVFVSLDGGFTWIRDQGNVPGSAGGAVSIQVGQAASVMVVSPRSPRQVFLTENAGVPTPRIWRGQYRGFTAANPMSRWDVLVQPPAAKDFPNRPFRDSGNVFVFTTPPGRGDLLFFNPIRTNAYVGPLDPRAESDWVMLDRDHTVHVDLHGMWLTGDFEASLEDGYQVRSGTLWMLSDGGIFRSRNGGITFEPASRNVRTLSCVNIAGAAQPGKGPALSVNTGDNDGFYSFDGGKNWRSMDYGGGDNDCSFADPLRPQSMLVFTPRWNTDGDSVPASQGNTVTVYESQAGDLPNAASGTGTRHVVPGPPLRPRTTLWNGSSGFVLRGFRPLVLNMPGDDADEPGDYVFTRFFGNLFDENGTLILPNHLAVLLRTRRIGDIDRRTDWDTPGTWRVEKHVRLLADLTGNGRADIVGFGDDGVWTALSNGDGTFATPRFVLADFGFEAGGWRVDKHPRFLVDLTGTGGADIVGFGDDGVWTALGSGDGTFQPPRFVLADLGFEAGGWRVDRHPRFLVNLTGTGGADIVGFGDDGVWTALGNGDGTFQPPRFVLADLGFEAGGWRVEKHPRVLADLSGTGRIDIVGFGTDGVWTAIGNGDGTFQPPQFVLADLGFEAGGWRVEKHPRVLAPLTDTGRADIVGFGDAGVWTALSNGDGTFQPPQFVLADLGFEAGGWRVEKHPRVLADLTGNGRADIVGFGDAGVWTALSNGDGTFQPLQFVLADYGFGAGDWRVERHPRLVANVTTNAGADIVGFGDAGVLVAPGNGSGSFRQVPMFVIPNFGFGSGGPVQQQGPFLPSPNAGVVQASGGHVGTVFYVGGDPASRLWKWTEGMAAWQQLVPGGIATQARRFFVNPYDPNLVYVLDQNQILRSDDGGSTWNVDANLQQQLTCGGRIAVGQGRDVIDIVLTDMQFDPVDAGRRFAVGIAGAFMAVDGVSWQRLLDTGAMRGLPTNCYYDRVSNDAEKALYVGFAGRSVVKIAPL